MSDSPYVNDDFLDVAELAAWLQHHPCATCGDSPPRTASPTTRSVASSGFAAERSKIGSRAMGGDRPASVSERASHRSSLPRRDLVVVMVERCEARSWEKQGPGPRRRRSAVPKNLPQTSGRQASRSTSVLSR